ncbi:hypothetical protein N480_14125 [Pseudoalteromonas luteoviolacea S2607]|uniref:hypothetical protein n=1 Tax=Pseudoalteromonas luteoviolacea TaxID=43657 RepID=UPI0007B0709D|nr:hypothetical protein [Pseudoalteromonas luteoviolacea]KZN37876.1 hypothetical protein N480_14125 [Pseudoalteromonas luteoviolacea S2607]
MKVYFFVTGNLAAETLLIAADELKSKCPDLEVELLTDGILPTLSNDLVSSTMKPHNMEKEIGLEKGDIVITGMMWPGDKERKIFREAKKSKAKSVVLLQDISGDANKFMYQGTLHLPDHICVSDTLTYENLLNIGIPKNKVVSLGSLYLDNLFKEIKKDNYYNKNRKIGYLTVPNESDFKNWGSSYGYDEVEVGEDLIELGERLNMDLIIRKHPKEHNSDKYDYLGSNSIECEVTSHKDASIIDFISSCDVVVSTYSTTLIIAKKMGKKVISYQPTSNNAFRGDVYNRLGIPVTKSKEELYSYILASNFQESKCDLGSVIFNYNHSGEKFSSFIDELRY